MYFKTTHIIRFRYTLKKRFLWLIMWFLWHVNTESAFSFPTTHSFYQYTTSYLVHMYCEPFQQYVSKNFHFRNERSLFYLSAHHYRCNVAMFLTVLNLLIDIKFCTNDETNTFIFLIYTFLIWRLFVPIYIYWKEAFWQTYFYFCKIFICLNSKACSA